LMTGDVLQLHVGGSKILVRVVKMGSNGVISLAPLSEGNVDARNRDRDSGFRYLTKSPGSLQSAKARMATVSPIGELSYPQRKAQD
jgi:hypothetical protein